MYLVKRTDIDLSTCKETVGKNDEFYEFMKEGVWHFAVAFRNQVHFHYLYFVCNITRIHLMQFGFKDFYLITYHLWGQLARQIGMILFP